MNHYTLDEDHVVHGPMSFEDWLPWAIEVEDWEVFKRLCIVAQTYIDGDCWVSTVFLRGVDHSFLGRGHPPLLFGTAVFGGGDFDGDQERYSTWAEAEAGHQRIVDKIMNPVGNKKAPGATATEDGATGAGG